MHPELLALLRCPYCGGRFELVRSSFHRTDGDVIHDAVIACECCVFPVVDGIPVLHLQPTAVAAREHIEAGAPDLALRAMVGLDDPAAAERFGAAARASDATYRDMVDALGAGFEGGYFLYRFSDPTFVVAEAVVQAVAGTALRSGGRALDVCGGSGHLTRALVPLSSPAPVLADLFYAKIWLARRFTAPGVLPVCCDANSPLPFARGAFDVAMCSDAFMFVWTKRQFVGELFRAVAGSPRATVLINHTHNQLVWSPSHGQALTPAGYRDLFETRKPRMFGESALFADVVQGSSLDLTREESLEALAADAALTLVASDVPGVFASHPLGDPQAAGGEWRINPLYALDDQGDRLRGVLRFPSADYADEYGSCRAYLPDEVVVVRSALDALQRGLPDARAADGMADLIRRRVIVSLPRRYY